MIEFVALRAKTWVYLKDDDSGHKIAGGTKKCVIKRELMFENYIDCLFNNKTIILFNNKTIIKSQQRFKSDSHNVCTEEINKIALSNND